MSLLPASQNKRKKGNKRFKICKKKQNNCIKTYIYVTRRLRVKEKISKAMKGMGIISNSGKVFPGILLSQYVNFICESSGICCCNLWATNQRMFHSKNWKKSIKCYHYHYKDHQRNISESKLYSKLGFESYNIVVGLENYVII